MLLGTQASAKGPATLWHHTAVGAHSERILLAAARGLPQPFSTLFPSQCILGLGLRSLLIEFKTDSVTYHPLITRQARQLHNPYTDVFVGPLERKCSHGRHMAARRPPVKEEMKLERNGVLCSVCLQVSLETWHVTNEDSRAGGEVEGGAGR